MNGDQITAFQVATGGAASGTLPGEWRLTFGLIFGSFLLLWAGWSAYGNIRSWAGGGIDFHDLLMGVVRVGMIVTAGLYFVR